MGGLAILALIICYKLAISNTITEYKKYNIALTENNEINQSGDLLTDLNYREQKINDLFNKFVLDTLQPSKNLLNVSSEYCGENNLKLKEYRPWHFSKNDSIQVLTRIITVEGSFIDCVKLLHELESVRKLGKVGSADFRSYKDPSDKKVKLNCTIYIQNLITGKYEKN